MSMLRISINQSIYIAS